jgi:p-aminobenzoyl-glutamate transporter AbgT
MDLSTLPLGVLVGIGVVAVLEIALDVIALIALFRRPAGGVVGNKWLWAAFIVLINPIGAILFFAVGRKRAQVVEQGAAQPKRSAADIADALYGSGDESPKP